jgi:hypothetical protein
LAAAGRGAWRQGNDADVRFEREWGRAREGESESERERASESERASEREGGRESERERERERAAMADGCCDGLARDRVRQQQKPRQCATRPRRRWAPRAAAHGLAAWRITARSSDESAGGSGLAAPTQTVIRRATWHFVVRRAILDAEGSDRRERTQRRQPGAANDAGDGTGEAGTKGSMGGVGEWPLR